MRVTDIIKKQVFLVRDRLQGGHASLEATDLLRIQHRDVEMLFARILSSDDNRERKSLVAELADKFTAHMVIEQEIFYPACQREIDDKRIVIGAFEEHGVAKYEMERWLATNPGDDAFEARTIVLRDLIDEHVKHEEKVLFKQAERRFETDRLEQLGRQMRRRFDAMVEQGYAASLPVAEKSELPSPQFGRSQQQQTAAKRATGGRKRTANRRTASASTGRSSTSKASSKTRAKTSSKA